MALLSVRWLRLPRDPQACFNIDTRPIDILREATGEHGVSRADLARSVYTIRLTGPVVIAYPTGSSPLIYVGEGNLHGRMSSHVRTWIRDLAQTQADFGWSAHICLPRVRNNAAAYQDVEALLLQEFSARYGALPLANRQLEYVYGTHQIEDEEHFYSVLGIGRGRRPKWAIAPCRSHPLHERFHTGVVA
ncbi:hypothetical protein [Azospirillum soli]|uniref:hypothetical protein n=1 Tax=Azospirillum soli TaxID=1304799 RepID=UPI001AEB1902|nr:hypothetical protein [Azospirillum soli]MBP2315472.1 hypothetical protein [Azospirillum soli]